VREALEEHGVECEVIVIANGEHAIAFIDDLDAGHLPAPHLVILDLNLPRKPGSEVLKRLRASAQCGGTPVVILTSSDSDRDRDETARLGAAKYLRKPFRLAEFMKLGGVFKEMLNARPM